MKDFDEFRCFWDPWVRIIGFKKWMYICMYVCVYVCMFFFFSFFLFRRVGEMLNALIRAVRYSPRVGLPWASARYTGIPTKTPTLIFLAQNPRGTAAKQSFAGERMASAYSSCIRFCILQPFVAVLPVLLLLSSTSYRIVRSSTSWHISRLLLPSSSFLTFLSMLAA